MKKAFGAFFSGLGVAVLIGVGLSAYRHRGQIARRGRDIAERSRRVAELGRARGRVAAERGRRIARRGQEFAQRFRPRPDIDLNACSTEQLLNAGVDRETAARILENRPYRSKFELVERVMVPTDIYGRIKNRVWVSGANEPVKVAQ